MIYKEIIDGRVGNAKATDVRSFYQLIIPSIHRAFEKAKKYTSDNRMVPHDHTSILKHRRRGDEAYFRIALEIYEILALEKPLPNGMAFTEMTISSSERDYILSRASKEIVKLDFQKMKLAFNLVPKFRCYFVFGDEEEYV